MSKSTKARPALESKTEYLFEGVMEVVNVKRPAGYRSPKQAHGMSEAYISILEGELFYLAKDKEMIKYTKGNSFVIPRGTIHSLTTMIGAETLEAYFPPIRGLTTVYREEE